MMKMFEDGDWQVPMLPKGTWPEKDEVQILDLVEPVTYVRATCTNGCGYALVGRNHGVVVTVWGANSKWDKFVKGKKGLGASETVTDDTVA